MLKIWRVSIVAIKAKDFKIWKYITFEIYLAGGNFYGILKYLYFIIHTIT